VEATVVKVDAADDLVLLKAVGRFAPLPVAANPDVKPGDLVATVGFPDSGLQSFSPKTARGDIAAPSGATTDSRYLQIRLSVQPGNAGGALVDGHGNVVGVVVAGLGTNTMAATPTALPENVNYAVRSSLLGRFLESVPDLAGKLKEPNPQDGQLEDGVKSARAAAVLVLVY
jgi:S1-C subfamily serine protease